MQRVVDELRNADVDDLRREGAAARAREQDVAGLPIAMNDARVVRRGDRGDDGQHALDELRRVHAPDTTQPSRSVRSKATCESAIDARTTLMATRFFSFAWRASTTLAMPPSPIDRNTSYAPIRVGGRSDGARARYIRDRGR